MSINPFQDYYDRYKNKQQKEEKRSVELDNFMQQDEDLKDHHNPEDPFRLELGGQG